MVIQTYMCYVATRSEQQLFKVHTRSTKNKEVEPKLGEEIDASTNTFFGYITIILLFAQTIDM